jgi:hypothetical protein
MTIRLEVPPSNNIENEQVEVGRSLTTVAGRSRQTVPAPGELYARLAQVVSWESDGSLDVWYSPFVGFGFVAPGLSPEQSAQLNSVQMQLGSLFAQLVMSTQGEIRSGTFQNGPGDASATPLDTELSQGITQLSVPFPRQPIGVGARWRATTAVPFSGGVLETWTYSLLSQHASTVRLGVKLTETAGKPGTLRLVSMRRDAVQALGFSGTGSGTEVRDLTHLLPARIDFSVTEHLGLRVTQGKQTHRVDQYLRSEEHGTLQP